MEDSVIKPALTPLEWAEDEAGGVFVIHDRRGGRYISVNERSVDPEQYHALAALCLYGQPFGFTREDVDVLRLASRIVDDNYGPETYGGPLSNVADRIAALLPPREP